MSNSVTSKFKKGDKILGQSYEMLGMYKGEVYTVLSCTETSMTLEGLVDASSGRQYTFTPKGYELVEKCNYREMKPTDLITISIDGNESEVPLGDLVHATALLGVTNGWYGARIWEALNKSLGKDGFVEDMETVIEFRDKQKETLDYFFKPYYDKQQQEKEELANLISKKQNELDQLVEKLAQM